MIARNALFIFCFALFGTVALACGSEREDIEFTVTEPGSGNEVETEQETTEPSEVEEPTTGGIQTRQVAGQGACETDADCVPSECCHAPTCVDAASGPDCTDMMCTADFQFGTLDGGGCVCVDGQCAANVSVEPTMAN